jgi:hypothetical protein
MEDQEKIKRRLEALNAGLANKPWIQVKGINVMPLVEQNNLTGKSHVTTESGYPVKLFVHSVTGEIKAFSSRMFEK